MLSTVLGISRWKKIHVTSSIPKEFITYAWETGNKPHETFLEYDRIRYLKAESAPKFVNAIIM